MPRQMTTNEFIERVEKRRKTRQENFVRDSNERMKRRHELIEQAVIFNQSGGEKEVRAWFDTLPPDDKNNLHEFAIAFTKQVTEAVQRVNEQMRTAMRRMLEGEYADRIQVLAAQLHDEQTPEPLFNEMDLLDLDGDE